MSEWIGWHFLAANRRLQYGTRQVVEVGQTLTITETPLLCQRGFHASKNALNALKYAPGPIICRVTLGGVIVEDQDKAAGQSRTVLALADASDLLHDFACWCAEAVLPIYEQTYPDDHRPRKAIEAKRQWLRKEISREELAASREASLEASLEASMAVSWSIARGAARGAARDAAWAAAWAASREASREDATAVSWSIARGAATASAWAAAREASREASRAVSWNIAKGAATASAWDAARYGAWADARYKQNTELERRLTELLAA